MPASIARTLWRNASISDGWLLAAASAAISPSTSLRASSSSNGPGPSSRRRLARHGAGRDENAGTDAHLNQAADLQRDDGFAHRCAAYAERCGELALGGQPRPRQELAARDQLSDLLGNLSV
jgi:hypothetical protein